MRVLQVITYISPKRGGPSHSTLAAVRAHLEADPDARTTVLSTTALLDADERARLEAALPPSADVRLLRLYGSHTASFSPALTRWMVRNVRAYDLVVVRTMMNPQMTTAAAIARRAGVPYVVTPHGSLSGYVFEHRRSGTKRLYMQHVEARSLRGAAAVQCTTEGEAEQVRRLGHARRIEVIPHPVQAPPPTTTIAESDTLTCLARLDPVKGFDVLLPAFARVVASRPHARLLIAGNGSAAYASHLSNEVDALKLSGHVEFVGFVRDAAKAEFLARGVAMVLPSRKENFGISVVEAMAAGRAVIVSPEVNLASAIEGAGAGWVAPRDPETLARVLLDVLTNPSEATVRGARGAAFSAATYSSAAVGAQLAQLYRDVARHRAL